MIFLVELLLSLHFLLMQCDAKFTSADHGNNDEDGGG